MKELKALNAELEVLYKKEQGLRKKYYNQIEDMKGKIRVYARCRPFAGYEKEKQCKQCVTFIDDVNCKVRPHFRQLAERDAETKDSDEMPQRPARSDATTPRAMF
eukprot:946911-Rhodomonas_salina.10